MSGKKVIFTSWMRQKNNQSETGQNNLFWDNLFGTCQHSDWLKYPGDPGKLICSRVHSVSSLTWLLKMDVTYQACFNWWSPCNMISHIEIQTVDGFEGCKNKVFIFSTMQNNAVGYTGFFTNKQCSNIVQKGIWLSWAASIQVKQDEWGWERECCSQGGHVHWVMEASCTLFDGLLMFTVDGKLCRGHSPASSWIGEILFIFSPWSIFSIC